jgi:hypothetical protein
MPLSLGVISAILASTEAAPALNAIDYVNHDANGLSFIAARRMLSHARAVYVPIW